jgi:flagellar motor switch protein FliN
MKSFLEIWGEAFPKGVSALLQAEAEWVAAEDLPPNEGNVAVALRWSGASSGAWSGAWNGACTLVCSRIELEPLLAARSLLGEGAAATPESFERAWVELLRAVVELMPLAAMPASIEPCPRPRGVPLAPFQLVVEGQSVRMALHCDLAMGEQPAGPGKTETGQRTETGPGHPPGSAGGARSSGAAAPANSASNLDLLLDIEVDASLRFGARELPIRELMEVGPGDVIELDRHISDPVDLVVGDKIVARGEVVLVNGAFALRITEVAEPKKCLESVRCLF